MSNRFYNENVEKFMSEESKYTDAQIEEIKTITTPIIATDNPPIDSLSKPSLFVLFNCSNKRHTRKMTIAIKKILLLI